ncbi:glycosyltransferase family 2 protein [candidate division FCPU426 bacterium]|nr:glycosyltransferase family 2 protein [candidate division FCPU426 bacterium]
MKTPDISVVIPCLNEEKTIRQCIHKAQKAFRQLKKKGEVVVVDNGSTDRSAAIAAKAGARVVHHAVRGYGSALKRGFAESKGRYLIMGDGDNTYDFSAIPQFIGLLEKGAELVMGSRLRGNIDKHAMPWLHRWVGTPVLTAVMNLFYGSRISDTNCGLRGMTKKAVHGLNLRCNGMEFATEMVIKAAQKKLAIEEIPIDYHATLPDRVPNLHTFRDGWRHLRFILILAPKYLFLTPGLVLFFFGLGLSALLFIRNQVTFMQIPLGLSTAMFANALLFMGLQIGLFGIYAIIFNTSQGLLEEDRLSRWINKYFNLEMGLVLGSLVLLLGFVLSGITISILLEVSNAMAAINIPVTKLALLAVFTVLLGIQIVFSSFYLSLFNLKKTLE